MSAIQRRFVEKPSWMIVAENELGEEEFPNGENPRIIEYHQAVSLKATSDEVPWCSSFVNWVMDQCGYPKTNSAAARSWLNYGTPLKTYQRYAIAIFKRGKEPWQAHVGFAVEELKDFIIVLGGNQSNRVSYAVYPKSALLGYVWPIETKNHDV